MLTGQPLENAFAALVREGLISLLAACDAAGLLIAMHYPIPEAGISIISNAMIPSALRIMVPNFGLASLFLFDRGGKRVRESASMYRLRCYTVDRVHSITGDIDITALEDRSMRNRFMHVDEYMIKAHLKGRAPNFTDLGFTADSIPDKSVREYCRVYFFGEDKLLHFGLEFDVRKAYDQGRAVIDAITSVMPQPDFP